MPLPWKKSKGSRISPTVKDFQDLQSPKIGSSLEVEPGFSTSLVDVCAKNRDGLKKSSKKKKKKRHQQQEVVEELVITEPMPLANFKDPPDHVCAENKIGDGTVDYSEVQTECFDRWELARELPIKENVVVDDDVDRCWNEDTKQVVLVVSKMFVIVVLGLSTKNLAVGITMSAVALIFLEYLGKHIFCFLKPFSASRLALDSFFQRISHFLLALKRFKSLDDLRKLGAVTRKGDASGDVSSIDSRSLIKTIGLSYPVRENQNVEFSFDMASQVEENRRKDLPGCDERCEALKFGENGMRFDTDRKLGVVQEDEDRGSDLASKKDRSQTRKIKRNFMKKLLTRRKRKNDKDKESDSEATYFSEDDNVRKNEGIEEQQDDYSKEDSKDEERLFPSQLEEKGDERSDTRIGEGEQVFDGCVFDSSIKLQKKMETVVTKGKMVVGQKRTSFYLVAFVVVLAGLLGGRVLALVLTLACCFLLKVAARWRRYVNRAENKSPASVSE